MIKLNPQLYGILVKAQCLSVDIDTRRASIVIVYYIMWTNALAQYVKCIQCYLDIVKREQKARVYNLTSVCVYTVEAE